MPLTNCIIKNELFNKLVNKSSIRLIYSLTGHWPVTCTYDPNCTFNHIKQIESHWRKKVLDTNIENKKYDKYVLSMFPYPSGNLHLGHVKIYTSADIIARYNKYNGLKVHFPMGWDSFGLPAENAAIQNNLNPKTWTYNNIDTMRSQLESLGLDVTWKEATSDPSFYKWTQWLMIQLYKHNLLYKSFGVVNWDPVDETVLANDQVDEEGRSWRSGAVIEKRFLSQWFIKTSSMINDIYRGDDIKHGADGVHMEHVLNIQREFIGKPDGHVFYLDTFDKDFIGGEANVLPIFTDKPELLLSGNVTIAVGKDHWLASETSKDAFVVKNPFTNQLIPVIEAPDGFDVPSGFNATLFSCKLDDYMKEIEGRRKKVFETCSKIPKIGGFKTSSKYFDWLVSRQRYWGCPIPIIKCWDCGNQVVNESDLPVILPNVDTMSTKTSFQDIQKTSSTEVRSKLKEVAPKSWLNCKCPKCGKDSERETDTFDTFVDSSWYYLRYGLSTRDDKVPFNSKQQQVSVYLGGPEHAKGHLIHSRFMFHFLKKYKYLNVNHDEPFERLLLMGIITAKTYKLINLSTKDAELIKNNNYLTEKEVNQLLSDKKISKKNLEVLFEKMSKSKGNGVNPVELIENFGTDATRLCVLGTGSPWLKRNWRGIDHEMNEVTKFLRKLVLTIDQFIYVKQAVQVEDDLRSCIKSMPIVKRFPLKEAKDVKDKSVFGHTSSSSPSEPVDVLLSKAISELRDRRNQTTIKALTHYEHSYRLGRAYKSLTSLLETIRKYSLIKEVAISEEYEKSLMTLLLLIRPIIPHIASEGVLAVSGASKLYKDIDINSVVMPSVDDDYAIPINVDLDGINFSKINVDRSIINEADEDKVKEIVLNHLRKEHNVSHDNVEATLVLKRICAKVDIVSKDVESLKRITETKMEEIRKEEEEERKKRRKKKKSKDGDDSDDDDN